MNLPHTVIMPHPFEVEPKQVITESEKINGTKRYYDAKLWCEDNCIGDYEVDNIMRAHGITVSFSAMEDAHDFQIYIDEWVEFSHDI